MAKTKSNEIGVYSLKQAVMIHGKWDKSHATIQRAGLKLKADEVNNYNKAHESIGSFYELDKDATDLYNKAVEAKTKSKSKSIC